jgi:hypothetical protein
MFAGLPPMQEGSDEGFVTDDIRAVYLMGLAVRPTGGMARAIDVQSSSIQSRSFHLSDREFLFSSSEQCSVETRVQAGARARKKDKISLAFTR